MIDIERLKVDDIFYKAEVNGVVKLRMHDEEIQKYGSFTAKLYESDSIRFLVKEDYEYLFYTRDEAEKMVGTLPSKIAEELLENDEWIKILFKRYEKSMSETYSIAMKKAIKEKTGIDV